MARTALQASVAAGLESMAIIQFADAGTNFAISTQLGNYACTRGSRASLSS